MYPRTKSNRIARARKPHGPGAGGMDKARRDAVRAAVAVAVGAVGTPAPDETVRRDRNMLRPALLLMALHSLFTGVGLLVQPDFLLRWGGWGEVVQSFFPAQGGVFHIPMAALYVKASQPGPARPVLLRFTILVKSVAALFLLAYYAFVETIWLVAVSGVGDGLMAVLVLILWNKEKNGHGG
jgi:hypothetical protein